MSRDKAKSAPSPVMGGSAAKLLQSESNLKDLVRQAVFDAISPFMARLDKCDEKIVSFEKSLSNNLGKTAELEVNTQENQQQIKAVKKEMRSIERQIAEIQMEKSRMFLRIQNFPEQQGEDLKLKMAELLAQFAGKSDKELYCEIVSAHRVSSAYVMKKSLPRETFVRFSSLTTRNDIMRKAGETQLIYKGTEIQIRREIPYLVRKKRAKYKQITVLLLKKSIRFRYLMPEGLTFVYKGQPIKITTEEQMQLFLTEQQGDLDIEAASKDEDGESRSEVSTDRTTILQKLRPRDKDPVKKKGL